MAVHLIDSQCPQTLTSCVHRLTDPCSAESAYGQSEHRPIWAWRVVTPAYLHLPTPINGTADRPPRSEKPLSLTLDCRNSTEYGARTWRLVPVRLSQLNSCRPLYLTTTRTSAARIGAAAALRGSAATPPRLCHPRCWTRFCWITVSLSPLPAAWLSTSCLPQHASQHLVSKPGGLALTTPPYLCIVLMISYPGPQVRAAGASGAALDDGIIGIIGVCLAAACAARPG
jgi:hypothetical protein